MDNRACSGRSGSFDRRVGLGAELCNYAVTRGQSFQESNSSRRSPTKYVPQAEAMQAYSSTSLHKAFLRIKNTYQVQESSPVVHVQLTIKHQAGGPTQP